MRINFDKLDNNLDKKPTLQKNGIQLIKSFVDKEKLEILISEITPYFDEPLFNSNHGSIWQGSRYLPGGKLLKILSKTSLSYFGGSHFSQCFMKSTALHCLLPSKFLC